MLLADQIKENNIAEYVLYIWQTEDLVRGFNLNIDLIEENVIPQVAQTDEDIQAVKNWYIQLIKELRIQGKTQKGHCNSIIEILGEINYLHNTLINLMQDGKYSDVYKNALPYLEDFRKHSQEDEISDIHLCFNALYGKLILKLKGDSISEDTEKAFTHFRNVLGYLSVKYKQMKAGKLNF
jgi:hypothetical protein